MSKKLDDFLRSFRNYIHKELIELQKFKIQMEIDKYHVGINLKYTYKISIMSYRDGSSMVTYQIKERPEDIYTENNVSIYNIPSMTIKFAVDYENGKYKKG